VSDLAERIAADERLEGLTLSGGEPMQQAGALADLVRQVKHNRPELNVICFTGYRYEELLSRPPNAGVAELLAQVDLLIDGLFIEAQNDDLGLRGSANQVFHYLTDRLKGQGLDSSPRRVEVSLRDGQAFIIGIPPKRFRAAWEQAMVVVHKEQDR
jgi:anaerobic ribonucleoside-triphosphate reductase activating protein